MAQTNLILILMVLGFAALLYMQFRKKEEPKKEDDSLKIPREPYTGIKQTYILTPFNRHENIDLAALSGTNPGKPLFQVALSNNISRYVIWILFLEGKVKNYTMAYSVVKSFECEVLKVESTDINPRLAAGYFTHFYRMALLHETPKFHLTHR